MKKKPKDLDENAVYVRGVATHRKMLLSSKETGDYNKDTPSITPDAADSSPSLDGFEKMYWQNPLVHKGINIKANRVMGDGFELLPSEHPDADEITAKQAVEECNTFLRRIDYVTFFRQSLINAYVYGNEWTEIIYNNPKHLDVDGVEVEGEGFPRMVTSLAHGDVKTVDFRRDLMKNKILLDSGGEPMGFWQKIEDLAELYEGLAQLYGAKETFENLQDAKKRLEESQSIPLYDEYGNERGVIGANPQYMFIDKDEMVHLSLNNLNDNWFGMSAILPAYNAVTHLEQVMNATAEAINDMGYPKPVMKVGDKEHAPTQTLNDQAEDAVKDPVRKEAYVIPYFMDLQYLQSGANSELSSYPEQFITMLAAGLKVPRELLTGEGEANRATSMQASTDFEKDNEADRRILEEYIYRVLELFLNQRGFQTTAGNTSIFLPKIKWPKFITEDESLREKMILEKYQVGLITFNEAREMLKLGEVEDRERGDKYSNELNTPANQGLGGFSSMDGLMSRAASADTSEQEATVEAQHSLDNKASMNPALNRFNKTEGVDYKQIAQDKIGKKIKTVSQGKARKIRDIIVNGEAQKKSAQQIFRDVKAASGLEDWQVERILFNEHRNLLETAKFEDAKTKGMSYKRWVSHIDNKTSALCRALHGQHVPIDKDFKVTYKDEQGKTRRWKGSFPPGHVNCRSGIEYTWEVPRKYAGEK